MFNDPFQFGGHDPFGSFGTHNFGPADLNILNHDTHFWGSNTGYHSPDLHFVQPHMVHDYIRSDGTLVHGFWRDGDGDSTVNRLEHQGGGYFRSNPDGNPFNNLNYNHEVHYMEHGNHAGNLHFINPFDGHGFFDHFHHG